MVLGEIFQEGANGAISVMSLIFGKELKELFSRKDKKNILKDFKKFHTIFKSPL